MAANESLIYYSLTFDDGPLQKYVQAAVAEALAKARNDVTAVRREVKDLASEIADVKRDIAEMKHTVIDKIIAVVEDIVAVMMTSPAGRTGLRKHYFARREQELILKRQANLNSSFVAPPHQMFPHLDELESLAGDGDEGGGVDLDEERMKNLENGISAVQQSLVLLTQEQIPTREKVVDKLLATAKVSFEKLLDFLGLDYVASVENIARKSETESCIYLRSITDAINEQSRRFSSVETTMKLKIERDELEAVIFSLKDVRGSAEATARRCDSLRDDVKSTIDELRRTTTTLLESKVPWTDLEAFKKGNGEALRSLRESSQKELSSLRKEVTRLGAAVDDVERVVATGLSGAHKQHNSSGDSGAGSITVTATPAVQPSTSKATDSFAHLPPSAAVSGSTGAVEGAPDDALSATNSAANSMERPSAPGDDATHKGPRQHDVSTAAAAAEVSAAAGSGSGSGGQTKDETSLVKRRVYHATNAAYFNYAEVVPSSTIRVTTTEGEQQAAAAAAATAVKRRPQSALLMRK